MTEPVSLRRAASTDAPAIRDLSRTAYAKWVPLIGREPMPMTADYDRAVTEHIIDLVEERGELLALIEMVPAPDHLLIENIAVRPDQQGRGLGDLLLRHAETLALSMEFALHQRCIRIEFGVLLEARIRGISKRDSGIGQHENIHAEKADR